MRSIATYREHTSVNARATRTIFDTSYRAFDGIEELIDSHPSDERVYDYLQAWINGMKGRHADPRTIKLYFSNIKQYLHYRGIKMNPLDIKQSLNFPKKYAEELRPLTVPMFQKILKHCSHKREMLYLGQSSSGMRVGEMLQIRKKDIHTDVARLMVKIPAVFTKTGVARTTFFSAEAAKLVAPRLREIDDHDLVFGTNHNTKNAVSCEAVYLSKLQKMIGIDDKYETTGRNVITTHSLRAFFITKVSRHDANLARYFAGQKGYLQQYDRLTDAEKLENYMEFEPLLLVSDKARDREKIRNLENENSKVAELEKKNREFERMAMEFERRTMESERRNKDLERKFYELEDAIHKSITKPSGGLARQAGHVNKGDIAPRTSRHEAAKTQSPDYERGNRNVN